MSVVEEKQKPSVAKKPKKKKDPRQTGNFQIRLRNNDQTKRLIYQIKTYLHIQNMHILLYERHRENKEIRNLLLNPVIMKAAYANTTGGEKTREKVSLVKEALKDDQLFKAIQKLIGIKTNSHNVSMMVRRVTGNYKSFWTKLKNGDKDARPPKAKRLRTANHFSLPLESGKWSLKRKNKIGLTLRNKQVLVDLPHEGILKEKGIENITGVSLVFSNGSLYLSFTYNKPELQKEIEQVRARKVRDI